MDRDSSHHPASPDDDVEPLPPPSRRRYHGPERRSAPSAVEWIGMVLDEIDYGIALLDADGRLMLANHLARRELERGAVLRVSGTTVQPIDDRETPGFRQAVLAASELKRRCLMRLGAPRSKLMVSVVPLSHPDPAAPAVVLVFGKRQVGAKLSVQSYARVHGLSHTEQSVLSALCEGDRPRDIARAHGVEVCTLRTQITSIRAKTGTDSITDLLRQVAVLPPLLETLRH
jgi:DNA-binding CsgD family transcriptional regulator